MTGEGEALLAEIDDAAIKALRRHRLVWSVWGAEPPHFEGFDISPNHMVRELRLGDDAAVLHRFAISVVWRASASSLTEMQYVELPSELEKELRTAILSGTNPDPSLLPTSLIQITTPGERHNHTPIDDLMHQPATADGPERSYKLTRFYVDGLIFHCHWNSDDCRSIEGNKMILAAAESLAVIGITYEASAQREAVLHLKRRTLGPT